jgi:membrane-bound ClpP family serine protease
MLSLEQKHQVERITNALGNNLARALIFFSIAWFFLTVGVYTFYALSPLGIASLAIGVICLIISLINFARYGIDTNKARKQLQNQKL